MKQMLQKQEMKAFVYLYSAMCLGFLGGFGFGFFLFWQLLITEAEELGYTAFNKTWAVLKVISSRQFVKCLLSSNERRGL